MSGNTFALSFEQFGSAVAVITQSGEQISYQSLAILADQFSAQLPPQDSRQLLLLAADNSLDAIVGYVAALRANIPVILIPHDKPDAFDNISSQFKPTLTYFIQDGQYVLTSHPENCPETEAFPKNLAVCLSTSGTTGSAKLVKLSVKNINANAASIAEYLTLDATERAMLSLPMYYSYGLSVINSHLSIGASIVLNSSSVIEDKFWALFNLHQCTSFAGVPYSYELLNRSGFDQKNIPSLRYMTQAGGKLPKELVEHFTHISEKNGWRFYVMYGQTEATARMSYLPPDQTLSHLSSMGVVIPGGRFELIDEQGQIITETEKSGELIYYGPNVMMGYGVVRKDLFDDLTLDRLHTGDIAWRDQDDFYYISGRKSRFLKIFGNRIGLDEIENTLRAMGYVSICGGTDQHLIILTLEQGKANNIAEILASKYQLNSQYATVKEVKDFPLLPSGKIAYPQLVSMSQDVVNNQSKEAKNNQAGTNSTEAMSGLDIFAKVFSGQAITPDSSFKSLNGDSINYVQMMMLLEKKLGAVPESWQDLSVSQIDSLKTITNTSKLSAIETNVVLRSVAISSVIANHCGVTQLAIGGSTILFILFGYSFSQFQLSKFLNGDVWKTAYSFASKLVIPYFILCGLFLSYFTLTHQPADYDLFFMVSNFYRLQTDSLQFIWFIQVIIQIMLVFGMLFSFHTVKRYFKANEFKASFYFLIASSILYYGMDYYVWDTSSLAHRVPQEHLPLILFGWCAFLAKTTLQKSLVAMSTVLFFSAHYLLRETEVTTFEWAFIMSIMILIMFPTVKVPRITKSIFNEVASSAYYLYLTHIVFIFIATKITNHLPNGSIDGFSYQNLSKLLLVAIFSYIGLVLIRQVTDWKAKGKIT